MRRPNGDAVQSEEGAGRVGCLLTLALLVLGVYFGFQLVEDEFAFRSVRETARQQLSLGTERSEDEIRANLLRRMDELDLPPSAREIRIRRAFDGRTTVSFQYADTVTFFDRWEWVRARHVEAASR